MPDHRCPAVTNVPGASVRVAAQESPGGFVSTVEYAEVQALVERALPGCSSATYRLMVETGRIAAVRSDELIFRQGERIPLTAMVRGHGAFRRTTVDGQVLMVDVAHPGDLFGYSSIAGTQTPVDLVALTDGDVVLWKGTDIRRIAASDTALALGVIDRMAHFLGSVTERLDGFLHQDARRRVIRVLSRHRKLFFAEPVILSRSHLPSLVGTSREMTGRVLRELEREGAVARVGRAGLRLLRPDLLDADIVQPWREAT
jgi:CRP-like cAMP-binding protein